MLLHKHVHEVLYAGEAETAKMHFLCLPSYSIIPAVEDSELAQKS
jgi:hypothetical protein